MLNVYLTCSNLVESTWKLVNRPFVPLSSCLLLKYTGERRTRTCNVSLLAHIVGVDNDSLSGLGIGSVHSSLQEQGYHS